MKFSLAQLSAIKQTLIQNENDISVTHDVLAESGIEVSKSYLRDISRKMKKVDECFDPILRSQIIRALRSTWVTPVELSDRFNIIEDDVLGIINQLVQYGYMVKWDGGRVHIAERVCIGGEYIDQSPMSGKTKIFGIVSDTHLCNKHARLDALNFAYDRFEELGIEQVYHAGNIVDGYLPRINAFELVAHSIADQANYVIEHYPEREGVQTLFITADDHEGWWYQTIGIDFGRYLANEAKELGRTDLIHLGYLEATVKFQIDDEAYGEMLVMHPGGGTAYAISYSTQKIVESLQGGEKPGILVAGHFHKSIMHDVRNVTVIQAGCLEDQTTFMRKKKIEAHVGYWVIEIEQDVNGSIRRIKGEWTKFYNRKYHVSGEVAS